MEDVTLIPDHELLERVVQGDEAAFRMLFDRHRGQVFNLALRYTGSYADAEEISQDVFLKVYRKASSFRHEARFTTWMYRIAVNACLNYKRRKNVPVESLDSAREQGLDIQDTASRSVEPEEIFRRKKKADLIRSALDTLPPKQRMAFIMGKFEGQSYDDISRVMGVNVNAVAALMHRAKEHLKKILLPYRLKGEL